jgi:hypothetical protein
MTSTPPLHRLARLACSTLLLMLVGVGLLTVRPSTALAAEASPPSDSAALSKAVLSMEQLNQMRISLASTLEGRTEEPTMETMKEVCRPVGMRAVAIGKENGWQVRQVASKFRNPDHAPASAQEREVIVPPAPGDQRALGAGHGGTGSRPELLPPHQCGAELPGLPRHQGQPAGVHQGQLPRRQGLRLQGG